MQTRTRLQRISLFPAALLMAIAPALDMAVQRKVRPDAFDLGGYLQQAIGRTAAAVGSDAITAAVMVLAMLWLGNRYLYRKPKNTRVGEYVLIAFFSVMMLICSSIRATGSIQTLYVNAFQLLKVPLYLAGMFLLLLCALRALGELLQRKPAARGLALWDRHPFALPFIALCLAWLPHFILKYPGVLMIDSCLQFRQYLGISPRTATHPPFGTLMYGLMIVFAQKVGSYNLTYFAVNTVQTLSFIAVLSYSLWLMRRQKVPFWVCLATFLLYAVNPTYVGWSVVLVKDSSYLILCLLAGVLLLDFLCETDGFLHSKWRLAALGACLYLMILTRHNGITVAVPLLVAMAGVMIARKVGFASIARFLLYGLAVVALTVGTNEAIIRSLSLSRENLYDYLAVPFQQTARVVKLHPEEISADERAAIDRMLDYDQIAAAYLPHVADPVKWTATWLRDDADRDAYLRVWLRHAFRYPMDYLDAMFGLNSVLFDLQKNVPVFHSLTDNALTDYVYPYAFNDMDYYEAEAIRPLSTLQTALTEFYFRFSDIPGVGLFASMGFCVDVLLAMAYLSWVNGHKKVLLVMIPSLVTAVSGLFCPIVYTRYLLTTIASLPLWFAAYYALPSHGEEPAYPAIEAPCAPRAVV